MNLRTVAVIARLSLREIARRRILWVRAILAVASVVLVGWVAELFVALAPIVWLKARSKAGADRGAGADARAPEA